MGSSKKASKDLAHRLYAYYFHRNRADTTPWDKTADLLAIDAEAQKLGASFQAVAGTFWFVFRTQYYVTTYRTNEMDHPWMVQVERKRVS